MGKLLYRERIILDSLVATRRVFPENNRIGIIYVNTPLKPI